MKMDGRFRSLLAILSVVGLSSSGLLLTSMFSSGCGESSAEGCQSDEECGPGAVCSIKGECVSVGGDAGSEPDTSSVPEIDRVEISPVEAEVGMGLSMPLEATAFGANGQRISFAFFEWETSNPQTALVDDRGMVRGVSLGTATITAHDVTRPNVVGSAQVTVVEGDIASVAIEPDPIQVLPGRTTDAVATAYNAAVEPIESSAAVWSIDDETIATVDSAGVIQGLAVGQTQLIANIEGVEGSAAVEVVSMPVDRVEISPGDPTTAVGETVQLEATGYDGAGVELTGREAEWTSHHTSIATVDADGLVRGVAVGRAVIGVEMGVVSSQVTVTVVEANHPPVARDHVVSIRSGSAVDLKLGASDEDGDSLTFAIDSDPSNGAISSFDTAAGTLTYTSDADFVGTDSFAFSVSDANGGSDSATVTITVQ